MIRDQLLHTINQQPGNVCDDCLTQVAHLTYRQQAFSRCTALGEQGAIRRERGVCGVCGKMKNVSRSLGAAPQPVSPVEPVAPIVMAVNTPCADPTQPWYWEGNVQSALVTHLVSKGYAIRSVADTVTRAPGKDIIAITPDGKELWVSVKGYPADGNASRSTQARHWFAGAVFDLLLYRDDNPDAQLAVAFPDGFNTYQGLAGRITWLRTTLPCTVFWVAESGTVHTE